VQPPLKQLVVIDTNVWISGLVFGGKSEKIIRLFVDGVVVVSEEILSELREKVTRRFD
jgi:putative PIN family toxin of toxin-antitoxin system